MRAPIIGLIQYGRKRLLDSVSVRPLLISDVQEYMTGSNSLIMMPRGGWCLEGYGSSYRARLEHAAFRIYCLVLEALSDDASLLGGIMRRCHPWRRTVSLSGTPILLDSYVPFWIHTGGRRSGLGPQNLQSTTDPTEIDLWIRHHVRQHLVVDCRVSDASEGDGAGPIIALQVEQDALVITDVLSAVRSPLLRLALNSPVVAKITGYPVLFK